MTRVSVAIPAYNHGPYVTEAVTSALACGWDDLEVVIVDDGSTDDTSERLEAFADDPRVRIERQDNRGAHAALERAIGLAGGELVFILNSDDAFHPERVPRLAALLLEEPDVAVASSWIEVVDAGGAVLGVKEAWGNMPPWPRPHPGPHLEDLAVPELALLATNYVATTSNVAFRRSLWCDDGLRFLPLRYAHDWDFLLAACGQGRLAVVPEPLVRYRVHPSNTIKEGDDAALGQGLMRFEILWLTVRHARQVAERHRPDGVAPADLEERLWRSLPRFGAEALLVELLALRGGAEEPPAAYDALIRPGHPMREAAVRRLAALP